MLRPRTLSHYLILGAFIVCTTACGARAQDNPIFEHGYRPYAPYETGDIDFVNLTNGSLNIQIPLISYPQIGQSLRLDFALSYVNYGFYTQNTCAPAPVGCITNWYSNMVPYLKSPCQPAPVGCQNTTQGFEVLDAGDLGFHHSHSNYVVGNDVSQAQVQIDFYGARSRSGSYHQIYQTTAGPYESIDGSDLQLNLSTCTITDPKGVLYQQLSSPTQCVTNDAGSGGQTNYSGSALRTDKDGNQIAVSSNGWTDSVGRNIPVSVATSDYSGCTGNLSVTRAAVWNPPGLNGGYYPLKFCYASVPLNVGCSTGTSHCNGIHTNIEQLQSILLPNGTTWTFAYDTSSGYGDLIQITLPTGGTISYTWGHGITCGSSPAAQLNPMVLSRAFDPNDGSGKRTWQYAYTPSWNQNPFTVTTVVTDPEGDDIVHTATVLNTAAPNLTCGLYETKVQSYQGPQASGSILKTVITDYSFFLYNYGTQLSGVVPIRTTTVWANGQTTKTERDYDPGFAYKDPDSSVSTIYSTRWGKVVQERAFDYGNNAPGPLLRRTDYSYLFLNNSAYLASNLLNQVSTITEFNSAGQQQAATTFGYDENNGSPQGIFGNQTSVTRWLNGGTSPKTQTVYNTQGMPVKKIDANNNATIIAYDSTGAFPKQIQYPSTNGATHIETFSYDANTGSLLSNADENKQPTSYTYDSMLRPTSITNADRGQTTYCYTDEGGPTCASSGPPYKVITTSAITTATTSSPAVNKSTTTTFDGLGRVTQTALTTDPDGITYVDTTYDALGLVYCVSNPYRTGDSTYGITTHLYDALGRPTALQLPDYWSATRASSPTCQSVTPQTTPANPTNYIATGYSGNATTVTDQAGKKRQSATDGLGRLFQVIEDPGGLGYITTYGYDALDNLTGVVQNGARQRSFTYDSLSRLVCASNPETSSAPCPATATSSYTPGTTGYTYDANGNLTYKTSPAPNQTGTATVTLTYCYDALNRLTAKAYTQQTCTNGTVPSPAATYLYDQASYNGLTITNGIGRRTGMTDQAGSEAWSYDAMGRVATDQRTTNGITKTYPYTYNLDGSVATDWNVTYTQGAAGRYTSAGVSGYYSLAYNVHYAPNGSLCQMNAAWGNTFTHIWTFNNRFQPAQIQLYGTGHPSPTPPLCSASTDSTATVDLIYSFADANGHNNGNVVSITSIPGGNDGDDAQNFTYDSLNRIASAQTSAINQPGWSTDTSYMQECWAEQYSYDAWGNLLSISPSSSSSYTGCTQESGFNFTGTISTKNQITAAGYLYDAAGNLIAAPPTGTTYTYDAENHLISTGGQTYFYDGDGKRVEKASGSPLAANKIYWYGNNTAPLVETDGAGNFQYAYYYFNSIRFGRQHSNNWMDHYGYDALGNVRFLYGLNGAWDISDYYPFGGERVIYSSSDNRFKFTGKERDSESGNDNFGARYYSSSVGRFMSPDWSDYPEPVPYAELSNPQSLNLYSYVQNNPINMVDDDGHDPNPAGTCGLLCRLFNFIFGNGSGHELVTVTFNPVQYPFPPASSVHADPFPMKPGVIYGKNPPGKYLVGGCPGGTCHTFDGLYPPLERNLHPIPWLLMGLGATVGGGSERLTVEKILSNPSVLKGMGPQEVEELIGSTPGWRIEKLAQGSQKGQGWVLREYNSNGNPTGRLIRWHPGGGHHGPTPYWRVSSGTGGKSGIIPGE